MAKYVYRGRRINTEAKARMLPYQAPEPLAPEPAPEPSVTLEAPDYTDWRKADLADLAAERGLDTEGTKADLIERLSDD